MDEESFVKNNLGNDQEEHQDRNVHGEGALEEIIDYCGDDASKALYNDMLERVGKVVSHAAKNTPHEVEVNNCIVERLSSIESEGISDSFQSPD